MNWWKYLLIGLPCQITSIELFLRKRKYDHLKEKIYAKVSLICGYSFDRKNARAFAHYNNFDLEEISYRERGRYRKTRLKNKSGELLFEVFNPKNFRERINNMIFFDQFLPQLGCLCQQDTIWMPTHTHIQFVLESLALSQESCIAVVGL